MTETSKRSHVTLALKREHAGCSATCPLLGNGLISKSCLPVITQKNRAELMLEKKNVIDNLSAPPARSTMAERKDVRSKVLGVTTFAPGCFRSSWLLSTLAASDPNLTVDSWVHQALQRRNLSKKLEVYSSSSSSFSSDQSNGVFSRHGRRFFLWISLVPRPVWWNHSGRG